MAMLARVREVAVVRRDNKTDWVMFTAVLVLSALGLLMIYSATRRGGAFSMERQMIFVAAGMIIFLIASNIDYREYRGTVPAAFALMVILLLTVFLFEESGGAQRWIPLGFFKLQPAEFAKVVVIVTLANLLAPSLRVEAPGHRPLPWSKVGQAVAVVAPPAVLIFLEPDLGTMMVFGFVLFAMLFVAGATWRQMLTLGSTAVAGAAAVWVFRDKLLRPHQLARFEALFDENADPETIGYQLNQSKSAIGSGRLTGKGLFTEGTLTDFDYIPLQENDFIFTAVAEQLGLLGGLFVLAAFAVVVWRLLAISANSRDRFGALIAAGAAAMIAFHVFINVGMTIGIMPVTGLPLPFLSQGGSFYMAMALALGITNSVWLMRTPVPTENQLI